ncbi:MAG: ROK family protein, partial [Thermoleophilia bacterium]|nr:ROK family protein [Thermoleophilia bacterium]
MSGPKTIGLDLGGTKLLVGVVGDGPAVLYRDLAASQGRTQDELLELLERVLGEAIAAYPETAAIGLGVPC